MEIDENALDKATEAHINVMCIQRTGDMKERVRAAIQCYLDNANKHTGSDPREALKWLTSHKVEISPGLIEIRPGPDPSKASFEKTCRKHPDRLNVGGLNYGQCSECCYVPPKTSEKK